MLSRNDILITSPSVIILLSSDVTHCSNVGYYRSDKYVFIIHLLNVPLTQFLFTDTNNIVSDLNSCLPSLVRVFFLYR